MAKMKHYLYAVIGLNEPSATRAAKVSARDFLSWAGKDLKSHDKRARGNALSNIKKALHARLDELISRTHVPFSRDWNPRQVNTDRKLQVIRKLGIKHEAIVGLITDIRNKYEHGYVVPPLKVVQAYLSMCELWLDKTYEIYDFSPIVIANLPITGISCGAPKANGSVVTMAKFDEPTKVSFFRNSKKTLVTLQPDGNVDERRFKDFTAQQMLQFEAPLIKNYFSADSRAAFNQASLTDLFGRYRRWLKRYLVSSAQRS